MVTRKKESGTNTLNYVIPAMILFTSIVIFYYMSLWDHIRLSHEELHNQLQMSLNYVMTGQQKNALHDSTNSNDWDKEDWEARERNRLQIILDDQSVNDINAMLDDETELTDVQIIDKIKGKPLQDGSARYFAETFNALIRENFQLDDEDRPMQGAIVRLSNTKQIHVKQLVVIEKVTKMVLDKTIPGNTKYERKELGYIVYDFPCDNGWASPTPNVYTGSQALEYVKKINSTTELTGSTAYATVGFEEDRADPNADKKLRLPSFFKNDAATHKQLGNRSIPNIYVTEVMDITLTKDDKRKNNSY